jgi:hypothetical protein
MGEHDEHAARSATVDEPGTEALTTKLPDTKVPDDHSGDKST